MSNMRSRAPAYYSDGKSASKIGSKTNVAAVITTRSLIVGIPNGLVCPARPAFTATGTIIMRSMRFSRLPSEIRRETEHSQSTGIGPVA